MSFGHYHFSVEWKFEGVETFLHDTFSALLFQKMIKCMTKALVEQFY